MANVLCARPLTKVLVINLAMLAVLYAASAGAEAGEPDPILNPGNGHYYEAVAVPERINWFDAKAAAETRAFQGRQGHLATITSQEENDFITDNFPEAVGVGGGPYYLGGFQPQGSPEPDGGWQWVTGEPFSYTNWAKGEPGNGGEDCLLFIGQQGRWNDGHCTTTEPGYVVEYESVDSVIIDDFSSDTGLWEFVGDAYRDVENEYVVLTEPDYWQVGLIWLKTGMQQPFVIEFRYKAGGGNGADGLVFMFSKDRDYEPGFGGYLGFCSKECPAPVPGYGIEFDNFHNSWDPSERHVALIKDTVGNHLADINDLRTEDNQWHDVKVEVETGTVQVEVDGDLLISWQGEIDTAFNGLGFGAGTGLGHNWHIIDDVKISPVVSPVCTLELEASFLDATLTMDFKVGTSEPGIWRAWVVNQGRIKRFLWIPVPAIDPPIAMSLLISVYPHLGSIGFLTTFSTSEGIQCFDFDIVDTGSSSSVGEASETLSEILKNVEADLRAESRR